MKPSLFMIAIAFSCLSVSAAMAQEHDWIPLVHEDSLLGWQMMNDAEFEPTEDGGIRLVDGMGWLRSEQRYGDFVLEMDVRPMEERFDSGIYFRAGLEGEPWPEREYQVNLRYNRYGWLVKGSSPLVEGTGFEADLEAWNHFRIETEGENATLWIDGEKQWETDMLEPGQGLIGFQAENYSFEFRNIRIHEKGYTNLLEGEGPVGEHLVVHSGDADAWQVIDERVLKLDGEAGGWIGTQTADYDDFDLKFDYLVGINGNSGVFLRWPEAGRDAQGMEIQLIDDDATQWDLQDWQKTGAVYHEIIPSVRATRKADEWQSMQITLDGDHLQVFANGVNIIDADLSAYTESMSDSTPLSERSEIGYIGFQNYTGEMMFRNMRIKRLND